MDSLVLRGMISVYLALIVFSKLDTVPPKIVEGYRSFEPCLIDARKRNKQIEDMHLPDSDSGYVCLGILGDI